MELRCGAVDRAKVSVIWSLFSPTSLYNVRIKPSKFNIESGSGLYRMSGCIVGRGRRMNSLCEWDIQREHEWGPGDIGGGYNTLVNTLSFLCASLCVRQLFSEHLRWLLFTVLFSLFLDHSLHNVNGTGDVFIVFLGFPRPLVIGQLFPTCMTLCKCACSPGLRA